MRHYWVSRMHVTCQSVAIIEYTLFFKWFVLGPPKLLAAFYDIIPMIAQFFYIKIKLGKFIFGRP